MRTYSPKTLEKMAFRLQANIYDLSEKYADQNNVELSELAIEAGFELDVTMQKLQEIISKIKK